MSLNIGNSYCQLKHIHHLKVTTICCIITIIFSISICNHSLHRITELFVLEGTLKAI